ncbi:MAG TPA: SprT-like domain-containing protein [Chitinophagaceae bacterium]|nr:SprT-like domain-containing protein [Chitinophagaceae bacterium]
MPKKEVQVNYLENFLPPGTIEHVTSFLHQFHVHLTITRERKSILGDYRHSTNEKNHRISVNGNLNKFSFLITLLHELAHLLTYEKFGNGVQSHGTEWKKIFSHLLKQFIDHNLFPDDIRMALQQSLQNPAASSCAEEGLLRVLRKYDVMKENHHPVEELETGTLFRTKDGRVFKKGEKLRKRFKCLEVKTGREYLFSPVYEIELLPTG